MRNTPSTWSGFQLSPFIFANFNGTSGDVDVITHECGHAFQGYLLRDEEIREFADITMETAEIHSMSMEYFAYNWMELFFGDRKDDYLKMHLEDSAAFVPYGCMVDEFQHIVYEKPEMTPAERKAVWAGLEKVYRPHMDYEEDPFFGQGGFWQKQPHIFPTNFYRHPPVQICYLLNAFFSNLSTSFSIHPSSKGLFNPASTITLVKKSRAERLQSL